MRLEQWTFDDLMAGTLSPAAETSARLLAAAAAGQLSRQPGKGFQPMPVCTTIQRLLLLLSLSLLLRDILTVLLHVVASHEDGI